ncbi:MAG: adenylate/guanylate cyclase domain-containing protein, partial [Salaquimonas sp.]
LRDAGAEITLPDQSADLDNDLIFAKAIERNRVVTGLVLSDFSTQEPPLPKAGHGFSGSEPPGMMKPSSGSIRNLEIFDNAAAGIGVFSLASEFLADGIIRDVRLLTGVGGSFYPTLAMEALRVAQGAGGFKLKSSDGSGEVDLGSLRMVSVQVGAIDVPTNEFGDMPIYHSMAASKPAVSIRSLMFPEEKGVSEDVLRGAIEGKIAIVGASAEGLLDLRSTPLEAVVPGVYIHADIMDQILSGSYLVRPDYAKGVELISAIVAVLFLLAIRPFVNSVIGGLSALIICATAIILFWLQFSQQLQLFSPVVILASAIFSYGFASAAMFFLTEKEGKFLRGAFSQYLAPTLVDQLARNPENLLLGGEEKELTLLFCDIRGFTSLSENLNPTELTELLNSFLTPMTGILLNNGATIDKYMGDAIMAFWNAPIDQPDHRDRACKSVVEMRRALIKLNEERGLNIQIGVGLNTGPSCVGNLGSAQRFSYSAIGDAVNVASRIEGLTKQYGLDNLASAETLKNVSNLSALEIDQVSVVGRTEPVSIYHLAKRAPYNQLREDHEAMISAYRSGKIKAAKRSLAKLRKIAPQELQKFYMVYEERLTSLAKNGLPKNWDGVFNAVEK